MARDYPHNKIQMQGKSTGRVYNLDANKSNGNNALINGMCHVNDHLCFVLFDYGATHTILCQSNVWSVSF